MSSQARPVAAVLEAGPFTTVQDSGRIGFRRFGVPSSGALDIVSLSVANCRLGNNPGSPALEIIHGPLSLIARDDFVVGHSGGPGSVSVDGRQALENPLSIQRGSTFRLEPGKDSTIVYLAFAGGLVVDTVMGSASTYTRGGFGGLQGRALKAGDVLFAERATQASPRVVEALEKPVRHRVVLGPHADLFGPESLDAFFAADYRVSFRSDRMGYRLEGPTLRGFRDWAGVLTFPVFPGMVQVTPDGLPIVLMADCQTTGGYPVIALVLPPDLCALAQKHPGTAVAFDRVSEEEAQRIVVAFSRATGTGLKARH